MSSLLWGRIMEEPVRKAREVVGYPQVAIFMNVYLPRLGRVFLSRVVFRGQSGKLGASGSFQIENAPLFRRVST